MEDTLKHNPKLDLLLKWLGYVGSQNWLSSPEGAGGGAYLLRNAFSRMGLVGAFALQQPSKRDGSRDLLPFVYVASAAEDDAAMKIHRAVWSQSAVPFLLVATPRRVWICDATSFSSRGWDTATPHLEWSDFEEVPGPTAVRSLSHLKAIELRSCINLDKLDNPQSVRVDQALLASLRSLSSVLTSEAHGGGLPASVANRLLGVFLHIYVLADRGLISKKWLAARGHPTSVTERGGIWKVSQFNELLDDLDSLFDGGVFVMPRTDLAMLDDHHLQQVHSVLRESDQIQGRDIQVGFLDIDLAALRTETLSAVYEMFFENLGASAKADDGAFYTPPFVVDHMLSRIEGSWIDNGSVVDCAAGSGIFLVGAYRRMLEAELALDPGVSTLKLSVARRILTKRIFGIEKTCDAVSIAAFSLYLTMLDYVGVESASGARGGRRRSLFPKLIDTNLLVRDLFSDDALPLSFARGFDIVVGNPPWQTVSKLGKAATARIKDKQRVPAECIDQNRAGELFFWTGYGEFLKKNGQFAMLLSAKYFLSPGARKFPVAVMERTGVTEFINLTHLRRKLFPGAEHPAIALFGKKRPPKSDDLIRLHYPLLSALPLAKDGQPWCLVEDRVDVEFHYRSRISTAETLFRALMLRRADRAIAGYLDDMSLSGRATTVDEFCVLHGMDVNRGGSKSETGLPDHLRLGVDPKKPNYYRRRLGLEQRDMFDLADYEFSEADIAATKSTYRSRFSGDIVLIPRSLSHADYIERPMAYSSSMMAVFSSRPLEDRTKVPLLECLAKYIRSGFFGYMCAIYARMWIVDRRRMEPDELRRVPLPFRDVDDLNVARIMSCKPKDLDRVIMGCFGLSAAQQEVILEYLEFRSGYENGVLPAAAIRIVNPSEIETYVRTLERRLAAMLTERWSVQASASTDEGRDVTVEVRFLRQGKDRDHVESPGPRQGADPEHGDRNWVDSTRVDYEPASRTVLVTKPRVRSRWTIDQAVDDGARVGDIVFSGAGSAAA